MSAEYPRSFVDRVAALADDEVVGTAGDGLGITVCHLLGPEHADPSGWWITYSWAHPGARGRGYGTEALVRAFTALPSPPAVIRRRGRPSRWSGRGRFGYEPVARSWRFPGVNPRGYVLYLADQLDLSAVRI